MLHSSTHCGLPRESVWEELDTPSETCWQSLYSSRAGDMLHDGKGFTQRTQLIREGDLPST